MNYAVAAFVSAVVWAALRTGVGYSAGVALLYCCGFFVASALFLGVFLDPGSAERSR